MNRTEDFETSARSADPSDLQPRLSSAIGALGLSLPRSPSQIGRADDEDRFRSLLRFSSDWYWEQDEQFRFTSNLRGFPERAGIRPSNYVGRTRWEMPCFGVSDQQWDAHRKTLAAHQPFYDFEYLRPSADGRFRWVSISGEPVFDADGRFRGYRGIGKDITERKQAQQCHAIEYAVAQILSEANGPDPAIARIVQAVCDTMGWDYGAYWQYSVHDHSYTCPETWCRDALRDSEFVAWTRTRCVRLSGEGLVRRVIASGEAQWVMDIAADPSFERAASALRCGLTGAFAFPVAVGHRTLGALEFFARRIFPPDVAVQSTARSIGHQIAQCIERKHAEERYRELVELSPIAILVHRDGDIVFANGETARLLGAATPGDLIGRSVYDFVHPADRAFARSRVERILERQLALGSIEMKFVRMDGSVGEMEVSSRYFEYEGRAAVQAIARDIGERKGAERKILRLTNLYAALSQTNQAITRLADAPSLFHEVCRIAVQYANFDVAAIMMIDRQSQEVRPAAVAGPCQEYVRALPLSVDPALPQSLGLTGTALRTGESVICNDTLADPRTLLWREAILASGLRSSANIPLRLRGEVIGGLLLSAAVADLFDDELVGLVEEMANNISFALDAMDKESQRREAEERLAQLAQYDVLTGLPNRSLFLDHLHQAMARARRSGSLLGLMFFDLDRFKQINDTLGHSVGDRVLQIVAARLKEHLREADTISRLGGDEFTLIVEGASDTAQLARVAEKVREAVAAPMQIDGRKIFVSASIGITVFPRDAGDVDELLKNADMAMYRAKQVGRDGFQLYGPEMSVRGSDRLYVESGLRQALEREELQLLYQPIQCVRTGRVLGAEALLRWNAPGGMTAPAGFIDVAEDTGLIVEIGRWVLETACAQAAQWRRRGLDLLLSANVSARQFLHRDLFDIVTQALERSGLPPAQLGLEITESMLIEQADEVTGTLARLDALGVRLAIDDFGTGYSSLTYLKRFPVSDIKIDQSFVRDLCTDPDDVAIVRAIIAMARSLEIGVTAEGVETLEQLELLQELGCGAYQGYLFSRPVPPEAFEALVSRGA